MNINILGCYGNIIGEYRSTAFLINDSILLDAGTVTEALNENQLKNIKQIIVTHTHIDHIKGIFPFVDELVMLGDYVVDLISVKQVLEIISQDLFNNRIWPDLTMIPSEKKAILKLREIQLEKTTQIDSLNIKPILMTHTVYTVGYVVREADRGFMFTADTGPTKRFWEVAREEKGIEFIIADVSFPNRLEKFAKISGHMTMSLLLEHLDRYELNDRPIYITHMKPIFKDEILGELKKAKRKNIKPLVQGATITI
jgi:ribonuclease BN (tRNA processing enzyme)